MFLDTTHRLSEKEIEKFFEAVNRARVAKLDLIGHQAAHVRKILKCAPASTKGEMARFNRALEFLLQRAAT